MGNKILSCPKCGAKENDLILYGDNGWWEDGEYVVEAYCNNCEIKLIITMHLHTIEIYD